MRFVGSLFTRGLLPSLVIAQISHELIGGREDLPTELQVEACCELLRTSGAKLESVRNGGLLSSKICKRLSDLQENIQAGGPLLAYSARIRSQLDSLLALRENGWQPPAPGSWLWMHMHASFLRY
eukprot:TRINITY_DN80773_c0_g1_i1.p2 TRINITY_DN80773_c0_g1~~TRINITY_DN80773_c0_g1_i1.p2  ORF type:complete len:125 (-),score=2.34 TRINITY_DN80773_c0_g1_i1:153-527(-)